MSEEPLRDWIHIENRVGSVGHSVVRANGSKRSSLGHSCPDSRNQENIPVRRMERSMRSCRKRRVNVANLVKVWSLL